MKPCRFGHAFASTFDPRLERCRCGATRRIPAQEHSETSVSAAKDIAPSAATLRARVLELLRTRAMTDEEVQTVLEMNPSTQRPRRVELVESGLVRDSGTKRQTRSGRLAVVWEVTEQQRIAV